jgi:HAD superfamily hydrolase (TIGR01549 family)
MSDDTPSTDRPYDTVFWDIGGVIVELRSIREGYAAFISELAADHGMDPETALDEWKSVLGDHFRAAEGNEYQSAHEGYRKATAALFDGNPPEDWELVLEEATAATLRAEDGAVETNNALHEAGIQQAIVSDIDTAEAHDMLDSFGIHDRFDHITTSEEIGVKKPDSRMFEDALEGTGADPERTVMVGDRLPEDDEGFKREQKLAKVDWDQSKAIASGQGLIYVIDDDSEVIDRLISDLESLRNDSGDPIARSVFRREDAYEGPYIGDAPNIVFDQRPGVHTNGAIGSNPVFDDAGRWKAENVRTGLFLADGPTVESTNIPEPISITDIAPTVLNSVDCSVPIDMDGDPLGLFGTEFETCEPIPFDSVGDTARREVQDRLEDLGYLE